jgi:ribosomal protein S18 acetylase RimI-like enzyme
MERARMDVGTGLSLRPQQASDLPFLAALYAATRERELAPVQWSAEEKAAFLAFQFTCQHRHYQEHYRAARFDVIERDGEPIGRLYLAWLGSELRIVDIALLPSAQRQGIGSRLLGAVLARAQSEGLSVSIHVERDNPALALYLRLGFELEEDRGVYLFLVHHFMARPTGGDAVAAAARGVPSFGSASP